MPPLRNEQWASSEAHFRLAMSRSCTSEDAGSLVATRRAITTNSVPLRWDRVSRGFPHGFGATHDHPQLNDRSLDAPIAGFGRRVEDRDPGGEQDGDGGIGGELRMAQRYTSSLSIPDQEVGEVFR